MARGKGRSGRRYVRDAKGRFASKGYVGQTGGRGARLKSAGKKREGGGEKTKITSTASKGVIKAKPRSEGQKYARRIQAGKDLRQAQSKAEQKKFFNQTQKKLDAAPLAQSSARQAATDRLKIKTATLRKLKTDRSSVIPDKPKARRVQGSRPASTVAKKPRAKGNDPKTVKGRIDRKTAVNQANLRMMTRYGNLPNPRQYNKAIRRANTLKRAQEFTKTGKLPGRDNSIKAQRERKAATARLAAKNAERKAARQRGDTASVNVPMRGSRGRRLDAEISRNVKQQKTTARAQSRARNAQFKSDQSRAKALRDKYGDQLAKDFAAKSGRKVSEVRSTIKSMAPSQQVKLLTKAGREQRAKANLARTADTRNQPGSSMIRRPTQKMTRGNLRAERALEFYKDPKKALKAVNKTRRGFKLPRSMRSKRK